MTRDSILALSRSYGEFKVLMEEFFSFDVEMLIYSFLFGLTDRQVSERVFTMQDVVEASEEGRVYMKIVSILR